MSESAPGGSSGESKEPVVRRKDPAGRAKAGKDGAKVEKALELEGGDGETILQQEQEGNENSFSVDDYLLLLKLLNIKLPRGGLNEDVVQRATEADVIHDAEATVKKLERFQLQFRSKPSLNCREVKQALGLKKRKNILKITHMIFFENIKNRKEQISEQWQKNKSNTGHGFVMKSPYNDTPISIPAMYDTAQTRSWTLPRPSEEVTAMITPGSQVKVKHLETMEFSFNQPQTSPQKFGMFFQNPEDEMECLKFIHEELQKTSLEGKEVNYTKGNNVEFGFLKGCLDFLAEISLSHTQEITEKIIIECKGTTGDMVGKLFTKPAEGCCQAEFNKNHLYYYQTQAYRYLMSKASRRQTHIRALMVVRHYHDSTSDFYWNYLEEDSADEIDALRLYCQEQALPRYLAILKLIFEKESRLGAGGLAPSGKHSQKT